MLPRHLYLTCHGLGTAPAGIDGEARRFWLPVDVFARTLVVADELERDAGVEIRFTFDDGNASDYLYALPLLLAGQRSATFFICAGLIGQPGYLDAGQLREIAAAGMTIGSHGYEHRNWRVASDRDLDHELKGGKRAIEALVDQPIVIASTPFGAIDRRVVDAAATAGFKSLFASSGGFATGDSGLIPRNTLKADFMPEWDLPRLASRLHRAWAGIYDTARRLKYRFY